MPDPLRDSFAAMLSLGDAFPLLVYAVLFDVEPAAETLFPLDMRAQRRKLMATLGAVVHSADNLDAAAPRLRQLGADHRRFGAGEDHYPAVGFSVVFAARHLVPDWTMEWTETWLGAYEAVAKLMIAGAQAVESAQIPAFVDLAIKAVSVTSGLAEIVTAPTRALGIGDLEAGRMHVRRNDRVGEWAKGSVELEPDRAVVTVALPNGPAGWGLANLPVAGVDLRLAPIYEENP